MKKFSIIGSLVLLAVASYLYVSPSEAELREQSRAAYADYISNHEFSQREHMTKVELKKIPKKDRPDLAAELDFLLTMDPELKRPAPERITNFLKKKAIASINNQAKAMQTPGSSTFPWEERGPNNVGGRTRAIMFDPNDSTYSKVWAGGVSGGLWYNNNIYSNTSPWNSVSQLWENIPISSICADPQDSQVFYVGTGEGFGGRSGVGAGIWKTSDAGTTWTLLPNSTDYKVINDLLVRQEGDTSALYVASDKMFGYQGGNFGVKGLFRSTDGGTTFTELEYNNSSVKSPSDLELGSDNTLWVATVAQGGKIFSYSDTLNSTLVQTNTFLGDRVEIATAPSDSNYVYAIIESSSKVNKIIRTTDHGVTWTELAEPMDADPGIPNTDFSRGQAWYDLIIQVDPNNAEVVITGAVDLFKSINGGTSWTQISHWYGGFFFPEVHADQHNILYKPGSSDTCLFTNDGGVYYTNTLSYEIPDFFPRNKEYNVTQFYACDIHPTSGENNYVAGSQDNGTQQFTSSGMNSTEEIYGGDGGYCFIDQSDGDINIASYVYVSYYYSGNGGASFSGFLNEEIGGYFINPAGYDSKVGMLYATRNSGSIYRAKPGYTDYINISGMAKSTHFSVSPYGSEDTSTIFIGTVNGQVFKLENADTDSSYVSTNITAGAMPNGSVSCIAIGSSDDELLVTFSNYGVSSVWYTNNGGDNWTNVEGDLPDMPVRWALFNPANWGEVILATELGVWSTSNVQFPNVQWNQTINGMENVRVNMLRMRQSDFQVAAATFGRGLFTSNGFAEAYAPAAFVIATDTTLCLGKQTQLKDISSFLVEEREWIISPNSGFEYLYATDSASKYPTIRFNEVGTYTVKLVVSNDNGADSITKVDYINVIDMVPNIIHENVGPDKLISSITGDSYQWFKNGFEVQGATDQWYYPTENNKTWRVRVEREGYCTKKSPAYTFDNLNIIEDDLSSLDVWFSKALSSIILSSSEGFDYSNCHLIVSDTQGRIVYKEKVEQTEISMSHLSPGVYVALITNNSNQTAHTKFVVQ